MNPVRGVFAIFAMAGLFALGYTASMPTSEAASCHSHHGVCGTTSTTTSTTVLVTTTVPSTTTTTTSTTTTTPPPTSGGQPGIGVLSESGNLATYTNPSLYSMVIGGAWGSDVATVIEKVAGRGLVYFDGTDVRISYSTGVTYTQALNNGWLLKCGTGYCFNSTYGSYGADIGSTGYQQAFINNVETYLSNHVGVDGIFIDNTLYDPKADLGVYPTKYPSTTAWSAAEVAFVKAVYAALHAKGYYVALNAGAYKSGDTAYNDGTSTVNWWKQVGPYADGLMNEYYDETSSTLAVRSSANAWYGDFDGWQRIIGTAQGMGVDFLGLTKTSGLATATAIYGKASFLLEWDGGGSAYFYKDGSGDPANNSWTTNIGSPTAAKIVVGAGYERTYSKGTVILNSSPSSSQTFTVNGTSYTLAPTTARILAG